MKKLPFLFLSVLFVTACKTQTNNNFVTLSGLLKNNKDTILSIANNQGVRKEIKIDSNGQFKDTLQLSAKKGEIYTLFTNPNNRAPIYLKNGYDITLEGDANLFMDSFVFSGEGADNSNFVLAQIQKSQRIGDFQTIMSLKENAFETKINTIKFEYDSILNSYNDLDTAFYNDIQKQNTQLINYLKNAYAENLTMGKGKPSPKFNKYIDFNGGTKSLSSFKGKYVYIDVWATWCGPCIQQIPYLKELEEAYKNKNIAFVSISTDESQRNGGSWEKAEQKWRDFVKNKNMSGVQLWSGKDFSFQQAYKINAIPRFILIDPKGNIIDANAPRPSDPKLKKLFTSLGI